METFGPHLLHRRVGAGGMAEIWLATRLDDHAFARPLAVKRMLEARVGDDEVVDAFRHEARLLERLSHPNLVRFDEYGTVGAIPYLVMEYVHGADLREVLQRFRRSHRAPPLAFTLNLIADLASALHHVHMARGPNGRALGIVHRDVSPHNLLMGRDGRARLTDFGIAKAVESRLVTKAGRIKGKVAYMAPEQARGEKVDARTDVYQLGIVFYECLTLTHPFVASTPAETMARIVSGRTQRPRSLRPELPPAVEDCVRDALRPASADRLPSARVLQEQVEAALARIGLPRATAPLSAQMNLLFPEIGLRPELPPPMPRGVGRSITEPAPRAERRGSFLAPPGDVTGHRRG